MSAQRYVGNVMTSTFCNKNCRNSGNGGGFVILLYPYQQLSVEGTFGNEPLGLSTGDAYTAQEQLLSQETHSKNRLKDSCRHHFI